MSASFGQSVSLQNVDAISQPTFEVTQLSFAAWNTTDGLTYKQGPGANLGATSFDVIDVNHVAFLCNSSSEIIITDMKSGKVVSKFNAGIAPNDFAYDNGKYYVLNDFSIGIYNASGKLTNTVEYSREYLGVKRLTRYYNSTYLLLPNGNSLQVESNGLSVTTKEIEGSISSNGNRVVTQITGDYSYTVAFITPSGNKTQNTFTSKLKVAGVFVVGATPDKVIIDVQSYISENPIQVERKIQSISFSKAGKGNVVAEITIPEMYFVLSSKEFYVSGSGTLYNMVTSPIGAFVFNLSEVQAGTKTVATYPEAIMARTYHFNDHLINPEEK